MGLFDRIVRENFISVPYTELAGSPTYSFGQSFTGERKFKVRWAQASIFVQEILGGPRILGLQLVKVLPQRFPLFIYAFASDVHVNPWREQKVLSVDSTFTQATYEWAEVSVQYLVPRYDIEEVNSTRPATSETIEGASEYITVPGRKLYWANRNQHGQIIDGENRFAKLNNDELPGLSTHLYTWTVTYHDVVDVPPAIFSYMGAVNANPMVSKWWTGVTHLPDTLLFTKPTLTQKDSQYGVRAWDISLPFMYRPTGWNFHYRGEKSYWDSLWTDLEEWDNPETYPYGKKPYILYPSVDMNEIAPVPT